MLELFWNKNNLKKRHAGDKSGYVRSVNKHPKFQENVEQIEEIPGEVCDGNATSNWLWKHFSGKSGKNQLGRIVYVLVYLALQHRGC